MELGEDSATVVTIVDKFEEIADEPRSEPIEDTIVEPAEVLYGGAVVDSVGTVAADDQIEEPENDGLEAKVSVLLVVDPPT